MSLIQVNQITSMTGTEVGVATGKTLASDTLKANAIQSRSGAAASVGSTIVHPPTVLTSAASIPIDFALTNTFDVTLSHDPTFSFTNLAAGGFYVIFINPNGSPRTLTWPGGVFWVGAPLTALIAANRYLVTVARSSAYTILSGAIAAP